MDDRRMIALALKTSLINYVDHETPRNYFVDGHADLADVKEFAQAIIEECLFVVGDDTKGNWEVRTEIWNDIKAHFGMDP